MNSPLEKFIKIYGRLPTERDSDYLEMLQMGKVMIVRVPIAPPGKCANCGTAKDDGRNYVDIGLQLEWYGAVYFCGYCINEIAKVAGLFNKFEQLINELQTENEKLRALHYNGKELQDTILKTFNEVKDHYEQLHTAGNDSIPDYSPSVELNSEESSKSGTTSAQSGTTKPITSSGSSNIPSLADLIERG